MFLHIITIRPDSIESNKGVPLATGLLHVLPVSCVHRRGSSSNAQLQMLHTNTQLGILSPKFSAKCTCRKCLQPICPESRLNFFVSLKLFRYPLGKFFGRGRISNRGDSKRSEVVVMHFGTGCLTKIRVAFWSCFLEEENNPRSARMISEF